MSRIIEKYRQEAWKLYNESYSKRQTWKFAILEAIFRPEMRLPPGKGGMTHLHPDIDKLHLPEGVYIADWRKYRVEDHPALINFQKRCHAAGLHDPWLRNFACHFYPNVIGYRTRFTAITYGLFFGLIVGGLAFTGEKIYDHYFPMTYEHSKEYLEKHGHGSELHH